MTSTDDHRISALTALRRHWMVAALIVLIATLVGAGVALLRPTTYTAETRLAIGRGEMSSLNIPGYPTAAKDMASNYARWVTDQGVAGLRTPEGVTSLAASPIPDSSVLRIEAKSADPDQAVKASQMAADALMAEVAKARKENDPESVLKDITDHEPELSRLNAGAGGTLAKYQRDLVAEKPADVIAADLEEYAKVEAARARLQVQQDARKDRYRRLVSTASQEADLRSTGQEARVSANDRNSRIQRGAMLGFGAGALVALVLATVLERQRSARRR